jgi:hypothetical protein
MDAAGRSVAEIPSTIERTYAALSNDDAHSATIGQTSLAL